MGIRVNKLYFSLVWEPDNITPCLFIHRLQESEPIGEIAADGSLTFYEPPTPDVKDNIENIQKAVKELRNFLTVQLK